MKNLSQFVPAIAIAVCLFAACPRAGAQEVASAKSAGSIRFPASYVEFYQHVLTDYDRGFTAGPDGKDRKLNQSFMDKTTLARVSYLLWKKTGDASYKTKAFDYLAQSLADPKFDLKSFGQLYQFGSVTSGMKADGLLSREQQAVVSKIARDTLADYLKQADDAKPTPSTANPDSPVETPVPPFYNIRLGQIAGYAGLLNYLKDEPFEQREQVAKRIKDYFDLLCRIGNTEEDATNYDALGASFAVDLAALLGRENDLKTPAFRKFFEGIRDIVSPSGILPEYGDSFFYYDELPLDRVYLMEIATRLYGDASFAEAAQKMRHRPLKTLPGIDQWPRSLNLILIGEPYPSKGEGRSVLSHIQTHNVSRDSGKIDTVPSKLILRTGSTPGDAMIMMDLYATGERAHIHHAHRDKGPSIGYYESAQVPLFHNMGRHGTASANDGNVWWALPPKEQFPGRWHAGEWFTVSIPMHLMPMNAKGEYVVAPFGIRNFPESSENKGCTSLKFDNLRFEGPAGTRLIDGFESGEEWRFLGDKVTNPTPVNSADKTEGKYSQEIAWKQVKSTLLIRKIPATYIPTPFTEKEFDTVKMDVKFEGTLPYFGLRGLSELGFEMGSRFLRPALKDATVEQRGADAFGDIRYDRYITNDSSLSRRIVLTKEGYLIARDTIAPGAAMDGWNGGQLWQLYSLESQGDHWFCSADDGVYPDASGQPDANPQRRTFVRFAAENETKAGFEKVVRNITCPNPKGLPQTAYVSTFSQRKVTAGKPAVFGMILVPVKPEVRAEALAKNVSVKTASDGSVQAVIQSDSQTISIHIDGKEWSVTR